MPKTCYRSYSWRFFLLHVIGEAPCEFCGDLYPLCLLIEHQTTHLNEDNYFEDVAAFPEVILDETAHVEPKIVEEEKQMQSSDNKLTKEVIHVQMSESETSNSINEPKPSIINDALPSHPSEASDSNIEIKKNKYKTYHSQIEEFTMEKGEKLLVYGADIEPAENLESEKSNNPLRSTIRRKEEDVIDIHSLSDDEGDESLEEFWKRARDLLKRTRGKI